MRKFSVYFFFFQAEDGIRDVAVTGVQTCALPIWGDYHCCVIFKLYPYAIDSSVGPSLSNDNSLEHFLPHVRGSLSDGKSYSVTHCCRGITPQPSFVSHDLHESKSPSASIVSAFQH